jgi:hypothetical protein
VSEVVGIGSTDLQEVTNGGKTEFSTTWNGKRVVIPAGKTVQMPEFLVRHILGDERLLGSPNGNTAAYETTRLHKRWKDTTAGLYRGKKKGGRPAKAEPTPEAEEPVAEESEDS